ncbi:MAG: C40 family peptidase, partial [Niameybacter sp.]
VVPTQIVGEVTVTGNKNQSNNEDTVVASGKSLGEAIVEDAQQFVGNPYVYGGNSLTSGVDCSGFTQQIMNRHGISISRTSRSQYDNDGYQVSRGELQRGDLVFFGYNGSISHVAIYIGDGKIIHSNNSSTGIIISSFDGPGKPYIGAKRVI